MGYWWRAFVSRAQEDPTVDLLLMSLKAGGVALNLTAASRVFLMDPWCGDISRGEIAVISLPVSVYVTVSIYLSLSSSHCVFVSVSESVPACLSVSLSRSLWIFGNTLM